ncbi:MAG: radical SAM protein [candidate division Zixibacteria bacterium]|nr:radical SAM protein [candidate division Zixibacteria bacterium]
MRVKHPIQYLRVSLLNKCNLNCFYCRPQNEKEVPEWNRSNPDKCKQALSLLYSMGVRKIRFTGGEPTLYKELPDLITFSKSLGPDVKSALTSNGILLAKLAPELRLAGLDSVNISIDTLDPTKFTSITSRDYLDRVLDGITCAKEYIPEVKLNTVVMKGVNDDEVANLIEFANSMKVNIRFIEYMPSRTGTPHYKYISGNEIRNSLPYEFSALGQSGASAARYYKANNLDIKVGFINPVSHSFCNNCNRLRLAADGKLYGCLFDGRNINLFELLEQDDIKAQQETIKLVNDKQFQGCSGVASSQDNLPSFLEMGG